MKPEIQWVIVDKHGNPYWETNHLWRKWAVYSHVIHMKMSWKSCRKRGDRAVKVRIEAVKEK
jgi:hypothetical protein